jgi:cytochrome c oxidase subunit II
MGNQGKYLLRRSSVNQEKEQVPGSIFALTGGVLITIISLWFGYHNGLMPEQASEQAPLVDGFFNLMLTIGIALFLVVEGAIVLAMFKFRQRRGDNTDAKPIQGNLPLEIFWTAIPTVIVVILGIYSVEVYTQMGGFEPAHHHMMAHSHNNAIAAPIGEDHQDTNPTNSASKYGFGAAPTREGQIADLVVNVTGMQFAWIFNYADSGIVSGDLHVPIGKDVLLNITAQDVIHALWVPQLRLKQDAIPGEPSQLRFVATKTGTYPVVCAELCGSYHGGMRTQLVVHTQEEYDAWLESNRIAATDPDENLTIAVNPAEMSNEKFLAPYASEMGINPETIAELHSTH